MLAAVLVLVCAVLAEPAEVKAQGIDPYQDAFYQVDSIKGLQGHDYEGYGSMHNIRSFFIEDCVLDTNGNLIDENHEWVKNGLLAPHHFEGKDYYFYYPEFNDIFEWAARNNRNGVTTSVVFLTRYKENALFLIDEESRTPGYNYYAPATTGEGAQTFRALFDFICTELENYGGFVNNFILGNEVNMPNSWHHSGSTDPAVCATKYANAFYNMWSIVRKYNTGARCSVSLDHSWQHNDEGRGIAGKDFLNRFNARLEQIEPDVDWTLSYHMYPAILFETDIWAENSQKVGMELNPKDASAWFVDGNNLYVMTDYIKNTFGEEHRVMLTEQGFSVHMGEQYQAASLAYSYLAAQYNPMVDAFLLNVENAGVAGDGESLDFRIKGRLAEEVYHRLDNDNPTDEAWIDQKILPIIGASSWSELIPNYGVEPEKPENTVVDKEQIKAFVTRLYEKVLGRTPDEGGLNNWVDLLARGKQTGASAAEGFFMSEELINKELTNGEFVELLYQVVMNRSADEGGKAMWVDYLESGSSRRFVMAGFLNSNEFDGICEGYGIKTGHIDTTGEAAINSGIRGFVERMYVKVLKRASDPNGIDMWSELIGNGSWTPEAVAKGFFESPEFLNQNLSNEDYVETLYQTFMDRGSDEGGKKMWIDLMAQGGTRNQVLEGFSRSPEFANICASYGLAKAY